MIVATWVNNTGRYPFNISYKSKTAFLRAYAKTKHATLEHAVDSERVFIIRFDNMDQYRKMK